MGEGPQKAEEGEKSRGEITRFPAEAAWALVMRTREGANGDQIAWGLAPSSPLPSSLEREAQGQDVMGKVTLPTWSIPSSQLEEADQVDGNRRPEPPEVVRE